MFGDIYFFSTLENSWWWIVHFPSSQALPGQTTPDGVPSFKLVLVGDGGTGKLVYTEAKNQVWARIWINLFSDTFPSFLQVKPPLLSVTWLVNSKRNTNVSY